MIKQQALGEDESISTANVVALTFKIYGSTFLCLFILFIIIRPWYPLTYNYCNSVATFKTPLNQNHFGHIKWIWKVFQFSQNDVFAHCGMDAIVIIRFLSIGLKLSLIGVLNSIYLIPVNLSACNVLAVNDLCTSVTDTVDRLGVGNVPKSSTSLLASIFAAYVLFISAMFLILNEFKWFTLHRHKVLSERRPDNYTVYVARIPKQYQSDVALKEYFQKMFSAGDILEARVALSVPNLDKKIASRNKLMSRLERSLYIREKRGYEPKHFVITKHPGLVTSIPKHTSDIILLNAQIAKDIVSIENMKDLANQSYPYPEESVNETAAQIAEDIVSIENMQNLSKKSYPDLEESASEIVQGKATTSDDEGRQIQDTDYDESTRIDEPSENDRKKGRLRFKPRLIINAIQPSISSLVNKSIRIQHIRFKIPSLLKKEQEGAPLCAGFVSFTNLMSKMQCIQMVHNESPSKFVVQNAPLPKDIIWHNVGLSQKRLWIGSTLSLTCTVILCLSWTVIIAFISSFAEIDQLKRILPFLERWLDTAPWLSTFLSQLKPLLLIILVSLLPITLRLFTTFEGHITRGAVLSSQFTKISIFLIVQIFFVQAISGSIWATLDEILRDWTKIIDLLATSIPRQVKSFIQYVLARIFLGCGLELIQLSRVIVSTIRNTCGPTLTDNEKSKAWLALRPLTLAPQRNVAKTFSEIILFIMILFVYSCIAPLMNYIMVLAFMLLILTNRNQLIYIYPPQNDTGGLLWYKAMKLMTSCMIIAEVSLIGIFSLKESLLGTLSLIPLLLSTLVFSFYLNQRHFLVSMFLPSFLCTKCDMEYEGDTDYAFLQDKYVQYSLMAEDAQLPLDPGDLEDDSS